MPGSGLLHISLAPAYLNIVTGEPDQPGEWEPLPPKKSDETDQNAGASHQPMKPLLLGFLVVSTLSAQSPYRKHNVNVGGGAGQPRGDIQYLFSNSPALRVGYGYRFHEYFQADVGLDVVFHAAGVRDFFESQFGDLRIRDYQYFLPIGGRAVLPLAQGRVNIYGGGGGAWLRYQENIQQPFGDAGFRTPCPVCASRGGWGYYALAGGSVAIDRYQNFRLGVTTRMYRANTDGDAFGLLPSVRTHDQWLNTAVEFTVSF